MYPKDFWYAICESGDVTDMPFARPILDQAMVVYRSSIGEAIVLKDYRPPVQPGRNQRAIEPEARMMLKGRFGVSDFDGSLRL